MKVDHQILCKGVKESQAAESLLNLPQTEHTLFFKDKAIELLVPCGRQWGLPLLFKDNLLLKSIVPSDVSGEGLLGMCVLRCPSREKALLLQHPLLTREEQQLLCQYQPSPTVFWKKTLYMMFRALCLL